MAKIVETRHFETAETFLQALSPFDDFWISTGGAKRWQFRGQRDDAWKLVSSAMRHGALQHYKIPLTGMISSAPEAFTTTTIQVNAEQAAVFHFVQGALRAGLRIPEDSQLLRNKDLISVLAGGDARLKQMAEGIDVPLSLHRSVYALAQHHGIPTRLLDWSTNPFIAAYFACVDVAKSLSKRKAPPKGTVGTNIAVFALRHLAFEYVDHDHVPKGYEPSLDVVEAPYEGNPNLKAQQGTFTLLRYTTPRAPAAWELPDLESALKGWCAHKHKHEEYEEGRFPFLVKSTVPLSECQKLLRLLADVQVCAPTIYPSYDAVRMGIEEEGYWDSR